MAAIRFRSWDCSDANAPQHRHQIRNMDLRFQLEISYQLNSSGTTQNRRIGKKKRAKHEFHDMDLIFDLK
jgi:hypothetical protein